MPTTDQHAELGSPRNVDFSIKGAASVGIKTLVTPQSARQGEFAIHGAALTLSAHSATSTPPDDAASSSRQSQHTRNGLSYSPHVPSTDLLFNKLLTRSSESQQQSPGLHVSRQHGDDAESSTSGMARSEVSSSKALECHICHARIGSLIKCSCNRRYHRYCHTDPPIPERLDSEWQCRRCVRKRIPVRHHKSKTSSPVLDSNSHKRQRLSNDDLERPDKFINAPPDDPELASNSQPTPPSTSQQQMETVVGRMGHDPVNPLERPVEVLENDDELDNLVAESFATSSIGTAPKKGGKLRIRKHRITVPGPQVQYNHTTASVPFLDEHSVHRAVVSIPELPASASNLGFNAEEHREAVRNSASANNTNGPSHMRNDLEPTLPAHGKETISSRRFIPKTGTKIGKTRCTSCRIHLVPTNPFRRTICQTCKDDAGTKAAETVATPCAQANVSEDSHADHDGSAHDMAADPVVTAAAVNRAVVPDPTLVITPAVTAISAAATDEAVPKDLASEDQHTPERLEDTVVGISAVLKNNSIASPKQSFNQHAVKASQASSDAAAAKVKDVDHEMKSPAPLQQRLEDSSLSEMTTDDDNVALSTLAARRKLGPKLKRTRRAHRIRQTQTVKAKDQYDLGDSLRRPPRTYVRLIHMALSDAPNCRLRSMEVIQWIDSNVPSYSLGVGTWAGGVTATLVYRCDTSGKNGIPTLKRYGPGGSEDWYELLPEWQGKVDRWDNTLLRPVSHLIPSQGVGESLPAGEVHNARPGSEDAETLPKQPVPSPISIETSRPTKKSGRCRGKQPARMMPWGDPTDIESEPDGNGGGNDDDNSSDTEPLALAAHRLQATEMMDIDDSPANDVDGALAGPSGLQRSPGRNPVADHADPDNQSAEPSAEKGSGPATGLSRGSSHKIAGTVQKKPFHVQDLTIDQILACRPLTVHTELAKAWPSSASMNFNFDYNSKRAEINARGSRKQRFGQKRPVDVDQLLAVVGLSKDPPWPPIDNSMGLTQQQLSDEMIFVPCETWDEFFGTTEEVRPCIVDGKLAYRPVGGRSRNVYKTSI